MKLLVINGPNLNLLGIREPEIYGRQDFSALENFIRASAAEYGVEVELFQSNHEGAIVDKIQEAYGRMGGIVINPAAYTHTSVNAREPFRQISYPGKACEKTFAGLGFEGYRRAICHLAKREKTAC